MTFRKRHYGDTQSLLLLSRAATDFTGNSALCHCVGSKELLSNVFLQLIRSPEAPKPPDSVLVPVFSTGNSLLQYLQTLASLLIISAQYGHFLLSPEATCFSSIIVVFGLATNAAMIPISGLNNAASKKKPKPERPLFPAMTPAIMLNASQNIKKEIPNIPYPHTVRFRRQYSKHLVHYSCGSFRCRT